MKNKKNFELLSLVVGFAAIIVFLFFLITNFSKPIFFTEDILLIRVAEILLGLFSIPFYINMILEKLK